jgi:hypothetical protein
MYVVFIISLFFDNCNPHTYLNTLIKHNKSKSHRFQAFDNKTPASSVTAQMDDLNSQDDDDNEDDDDNWNTNANGWDRPEDVMDWSDVKRDPILAEKVGV